MILREFGKTTVCDKCQYGETVVWRYCEGHCIPTGRNGFIDAGSIGEVTPHLHVACARCKFEWLERTADDKA